MSKEIEQSDYRELLEKVRVRAKAIRRFKTKVAERYMKKRDKEITFDYAKQRVYMVLYKDTLDIEMLYTAWEVTQDYQKLLNATKETMPTIRFQKV